MPQVSTCFTQGDHFSMSGRIGIGFTQVEPTPDDPPFIDDHCTDRNLIALSGLAGEHKARSHPN
jgi:hypothetical protein